MTNLLYSAKHYQIKCAKDKEAVEQIYEEVKKSAQNAIYRNIGDIFFTARTDTEINGAVECNGGTYSTADFEGKQNVGNLLANGSLPYVSLSEYESIVSANGSCRAFAWGGGTEFRVPTLNDVYIQVGKALSAGEFIPESLPNITGYMANWASNINTGDENSALYGTTDTTGKRRDSTSTATGCSGINFDASRSSSTYQEGSKVKPDSIRYRAMVQLANGATDQAVITATSVLQQVANKVDKTSATDRETVVGWGMPDYSAGIAVTAEQMKNGFTAPANGFLLYSYGSSGPVYVNNNSFTILMTYENRQLRSIPLSKGDVFRDAVVQANYAGNNIFFPCKGVI